MDKIQLMIGLVILISLVNVVYSVSDSFPPSVDPPTVEDFLSSPSNVYYCAPWGNNTFGNGNSSNPWMDLEGANSNVGAGDLIYLRGGEYKTRVYVNYGRSSNNIQDDGTKSEPIVITNYPNEQARFNTVLYTSITTADAVNGTYIIDSNIPSEYSDLDHASIRILNGNHTDERKAISVIQGNNIEFKIDVPNKNEPFPEAIPVGTQYQMEADTWQLSLNGHNQKLIGTKLNNGSYGIYFKGGMSITNHANFQISGVEFEQGTSNSGDFNPGMISSPFNAESTRRNENTTISHNYFHDSKNTDSEADRMCGIRFFTVYNSTIEYNVFENMLETSTGATVNHKDRIYGSSIRYNKFINDRISITFQGQNDFAQDLKVYGNLFYNSSRPIQFTRDLGGSWLENNVSTWFDSNHEIYNNVALNIGSTYGFYSYRNTRGSTRTYRDRGDFFNNIIDGDIFRHEDSAGSYLINNLPDYFDYNIVPSSSSQNGADEWDGGGSSDNFTDCV